jgi:hypothetical protein
MQLRVVSQVDFSSLCNLCVLCVSVVNCAEKKNHHRDTENTEVAQRNPKLTIQLRAND